MTRFRAVTLCVAVLLLGLAAENAVAADSGRSLPFNKQNVYNYFQQVAGGKRNLPERIPPDEYQQRLCQLYADVLKKGGYDFEATVEHAVQSADQGSTKLDDPRFLFLAGVFQVHPDVYLRLKLITKPTHDAVMHYFGH